MADEMTAEQRRAASADEYGTYVALGPISIHGVRAFNVGNPVPRGHVERGLVHEDQVAKTTTQARRAALDAATPTTTTPTEA